VTDLRIQREGWATCVKEFTEEAYLPMPGLLEPRSELVEPPQLVIETRMSNDG